MRHRNNTCKLGRTSSHKRCLFANMLKDFIENERIETTIAKAKFLKRHVDRMVTLGKKGGLANRRRAIAEMMIRYNPLTPKERRAVKKDNDISSYNTDRKVIEKLFGEISMRYKDRQGGYTRIIQLPKPRVGDGAPVCFIEFV